MGCFVWYRTSEIICSISAFLCHLEGNIVETSYILSSAFISEPNRIFQMLMNEIIASIPCNMVSYLIEQAALSIFFH